MEIWDCPVWVVEYDFACPIDEFTVIPIPSQVEVWGRDEQHAISEAQKYLSRDATVRRAYLKPEDKTQGEAGG